MYSFLCALVAFVLFSICSLALGIAADIAMAAVTTPSGDLTAALLVYTLVNFVAWCAAVFIAGSAIKSAGKTQTMLILVGYVLIQFAFRSAGASITQTEVRELALLSGVMFFVASIGGILVGSWALRRHS